MSRREEKVLCAPIQTGLSSKQQTETSVDQKESIKGKVKKEILSEKGEWFVEMKESRWKRPQTSEYSNSVSWGLLLAKFVN